MQRFSYNMKWGGVKSILALLLGLFLLSAAGLKMHGLIVDPYGQDNFLALPWLQVLTIEVELLLGLWLLSRRQAQLAWCVTLVFFVALACFSFILASQGQTSCGCFGKMEVNPWYTFGLDVGIVLVMLVFFPNSYLRYKRTLSTSAPLIYVHRIIITTFALFSLLALGFTIVTRDPWAALSRLRGETLVAIPGIMQLGPGQAGEQRMFQVTLRNYSGNPITVVGGTRTSFKTHLD